MLRPAIFVLALLPALPAVALPLRTGAPASQSSLTLAASDTNQMHDMAGMFMPIKVGDLEIEDAAIKAMTPGQPVGGGFVTIANKGSADDRLLSVEIANDVKRVELHEMSMNNDVMTMRKLTGGVPILAGETVEMKPGGLHMMIMGVKSPFKAGTMVHATLVFEKAGKVEIDIPVRDMRPGMKAMKM